VKLCAMRPPMSRDGVAQIGLKLGLGPVHPLDLFCVGITYVAIIEAACEAWQKLIDQSCTIISIGMRDRAHVGQAP
jgi:hypothetical protein